MFENIFRVLIIMSDVSFLSSSQLETEMLVAEIQLDPSPKTEYFHYMHFLLCGSYNTNIWTTVGDLYDEMGG